jgi:hypothetical protein
MTVPGQERSCMEPGYRVYPRVDCDGRFAVIAPNGCALPLRPLWENEAEFVAKTLNALAEESTCSPTHDGSGA